MQTISKAAAETVAVPFDFSSWLDANGRPFATYSTSFDVGLSLYDTEVVNDVVVLHIGSGTATSSYHVSVTGLTDADQVLTINKRIVITGTPQVQDYADAYADNYS